MGGGKLIALIVLLLLTLILLLASIANFAMRRSEEKRQRANPNRRRKPNPTAKVFSVALYISTLIVLIIFILCLWRYLRPSGASSPKPSEPTQPSSSQTDPSTPSASTPIAPSTDPTVPDPTKPDPMLSFHPHKVASSDPANWGVKWEILVGDEVVDSYTRTDPITFGDPEDYFQFAGVATFRGNNYRTDPAYGTVDISTGSITENWSNYNGSLNGWPGCGWTGQPLIMKWDEQTKQNMHLYSDKKSKTDLVEVIYGTLDGYIYFWDLDDGSATRDPIFVGMNMKGSGSLDPRGYPLMYVGSGDYIDEKGPRMYIISLIDGSILYTHGDYDPNALRNWSGFDSAPLVDAETDTLIWPGENGILYTIKLNTNYDAATGTISVNPDKPVIARYTIDRYTDDRYWIGMEDSAIVVGNYLYVSDNAGMFFCIDLNTMELIWAQDTKDDNNTTPVFEWGEDGNGYLYTAPSLHWTAQGGEGKISIYKLNAQTGEIVWEREYECETITDLSGGVQSSPALGKVGSDIEGLVFFSVSYTPYYPNGILTALDTKTGETAWSLEMDSYSWSSPVAVYNDSGKGYILMASFEGTLYLVDGTTGEVVTTYNLGTHMEASPVVYGNRLVVGTRGCEIFGLELG